MGTTLTGEDDLVSMWKERSKDLKDCLGSVILPIGNLSVGICKHHTLLFKICCRFIFYFDIKIITLIFFLYFTSFFYRVSYKYGP